MASKDKKGIEQWLDQQTELGQDAKTLRKLWEATSSYKEDYQPDVTNGFQKFKARIENEGQKNAGKVVRLNPGLRLMKIAAAAVLLLASVYVFRLVVSEGATTETLAAEAGAQKALMLSDGTSVTLNETSMLTFPKDFTKKERRVELTGEAFFEVAEDASKPFVVETGVAEVQVLGTSFNVRAYANEDVMEVYVKTGKVAVKLKGSNKQVILNKGDKMVFEKSQGKVVSFQEKTDNSMAWKSGTLIFKEKTFREIFTEIKRQYGIEISVKDEQLLKCRYTLTIEKDQVEADLNSIKISCPVQFTKTSPTSIAVSGTCCE